MEIDITWSSSSSGSPTYFRIHYGIISKPVEARNAPLNGCVLSLLKKNFRPLAHRLSTVLSGSSSPLTSMINRFISRTSDTEMVTAPTQSTSERLQSLLDTGKVYSDSGAVLFFSSATLLVHRYSSGQVSITECTCDCSLRICLLSLLSFASHPTTFHLQ